MKIRVIHDFYDKENDLELRKVGEEYEVTEERGRYRNLQKEDLVMVGEQVP